MMIHAISTDILWTISTVCRSALCVSFFQAKRKMENKKMRLRAKVLCRLNLLHLRFSLFVQYWMDLLGFARHFSTVCRDVEMKSRPANPFVISSWLCLRFEIFHIIYYFRRNFPVNKILMVAGFVSLFKKCIFRPKISIWINHRKLDSCCVFILVDLFPSDWVHAWCTCNKDFMLSKKKVDRLQFYYNESWTNCKFFSENSDRRSSSYKKSVFFTIPLFDKFLSMHSVRLQCRNFNKKKIFLK